MNFQGLGVATEPRLRAPWQRVRLGLARTQVWPFPSLSPGGGERRVCAAPGSDPPRKGSALSSSGFSIAGVLRWWGDTGAWWMGAAHEGRLEPGWMGQLCPHQTWHLELPLSHAAVENYILIDSVSGKRSGMG